MTEWWTYRPSDFLMFSAESHARLLEQFNRDTWPLHGLMLAFGLLLAAAAAPSDRAARWAPLALAALWAWVGWGFLWERFAEINMVARYLALAFWAQAALLVALHWRAGSVPAGSARLRPLSTALITAAVLFWPVSAPLTGRSWVQAEYFGMASEPTALATVGWLLTARMRYKRMLAVIPVVSLLVGLGTLWLLNGPGG